MKEKRMDKLELAKKYAPYIYFDELEPFFPERVGYHFHMESGQSVSADHVLKFDKGKVQYVIEYSISWYYDIQHLYELEQIWVYVDYDGKVVDADGSSHGGTLKALFRDKRNIADGTHVVIYSQPGKHAFCPIENYFELVPNVYEVADELVGKDGLLVTDLFKDALSTNDEINTLVRDYMQRFRFVPSFRYKRYQIPEELFLPWEQLKKEIPLMMEEELRNIGYKGPSPLKA